MFVDRTETTVRLQSTSQAKIALFRSLFRGREDVFARRFESRKTGKSGYAPACGNEWIRGICEKPRIRCADCSHQRFLPVTDDVIRWHLSGHDDAGQSFVADVYPMLRDEACFFLAADFDKTGWRAIADSDDLIGLGDIDTLYGDGHAENNRFERNSEILLDHREPAADCSTRCALTR